MWRVELGSRPAGWPLTPDVCTPSPSSHTLPSGAPPPTLSLTLCRWKVEKYMQVVFGLSACMLFVPVLYHQTSTKDVAPGTE